MQPEHLKSESWYWSKSMKKSVKFFEICEIGSNKGLAYVEFQTDGGNLGGAYLKTSDLYENWFDAALDVAYE